MKQRKEVSTEVKPRENMARFRAAVWAHYREHGRNDLPWRKTKDPYKILVSEIMLQQTQVPRVVPKYKEFLATFPTVQSLAQAPLSDVLKHWSGLGYNRRGKFLRDAAIAIVEKYSGRVPKDAPALRALPGIGEYTASAVRVFAYNLPDVFIETNIRSAYIHHFFPRGDTLRTSTKKAAKKATYSAIKSPRGVTSGALRGDTSWKWNSRDKISDRELIPFMSVAATGQDPREWHWALMDYGAHLKQTMPNPSRRSVHHTKQSKFEGSLRQVRGAILKELHALGRGRASAKCLLKQLPFEKSRIEEALAGLERDGMIVQKRGTISIV